MDENKNKMWIGVDFDGTLATYYGWTDSRNGVPILPMVDRVKRWLATGREVRILTARVASTNRCIEDIKSQRIFIQDWCEKHLGQRLQVTSEKDHLCEEIWDDRARQVMFNRGYEMQDFNRELHGSTDAMFACLLDTKLEAQREAERAFDKVLPD